MDIGIRERIVMSGPLVFIAVALLQSIAMIKESGDETVILLSLIWRLVVVLIFGVIMIWVDHLHLIDKWLHRNADYIPLPKLLTNDGFFIDGATLYRKKENTFFIGTNKIAYYTGLFTILYVLGSVVFVLLPLIFSPQLVELFSSNPMSVLIFLLSLSLFIFPIMSGERYKSLDPIFIVTWEGVDYEFTDKTRKRIRLLDDLSKLGITVIQGSYTLFAPIDEIRGEEHVLESVRAKYIKNIIPITIASTHEQIVLLRELILKMEKNFKEIKTTKK